MPDGFDSAGNRGNDGAGQVVLDGEDVFEISVIPLCPNVITALALNQLRDHANAITRFAHAACNDIRDAEFTPHI